MGIPDPSSQQKRSIFGPLPGFLREHWRDYIFLFLIAGAIIGLDQCTKYLVRVNLSSRGDWLPGGLAWLAPYARIRYSYNSGAAFRIFQEGNLIFSILATIVACFIIYYFRQVARQDRYLRLALPMVLAGVVGNLIDRIVFGRVTDFISVGSFAIFNVADASITVGMAVLVLGIWLKERAGRGGAKTRDPEKGNLNAEETKSR